MLIDDFIYTADVLIDPESDSPVGVFRSGGQPHALFVRADNVLCHLAPQSGQSAAGWSVTPVGTSTAVTQVAAGVDQYGVPTGFYTDGSSLYQIALVNGTWTSPTALPLCSGLGVVRNAITAELIAYGVLSSGALQMVRQATQGTWTAATLTGSADFSGTQPVFVTTDSSSDWVAAVASSGSINFYQGTTTAVQSGPMSVSVANPVSQVVLGYWMQNSALFLFTDTSNNLYTCVQDTSNAVQIAGASVAYAAAVLDRQHSLHLYTSDPNGILSVVHQVGWDNDSGPQWAPVIPLDSGFAQLFTDSNPADATAFFAVDQDGALWHSQQDATTNLWNTAKAQMPGGAQTYRVPQYRTEITVTDQNNNPVPNQALTVTASTTSAILVLGAFQPVGPAQSATVTTNANGRVTLSTLAAGLSTPTLTFAATNLTTTAPVNPAGDIHAYLSGTGNLNAGTSQMRDTFDSTVLSKATTSSNQPLAPAIRNNNNGPQIAQQAVTGIQQIFQAQSGQSSSGTKASAGWALYRTADGAACKTFATREEFVAHQLAMGGLGDWWDSVKDFAEDVWQGIKNGVLAVANFAVDVGNAIVSVAVKIGDEIQNLGDLVVSGIEQAAQAAEGVFNWLETEIDDLIDWLKMIFDWQDIADTANALQGVLGKAFSYVQNTFIPQGEALANGFFSSLEQTVSDAFDTVIAQYASGQQLASLPPPASSSPLDIGIEDVENFINQVENNWLLEKLESYFGSGPDFGVVASLQQLFATLKSDFDPAVASFQNALNDFVAFFQTAVSDPSQVSTLGVAELLTAAKNVALAVLQLLDAIVQALMQIFSAALGAADNILTADLTDNSFFNALWEGIGAGGVELPPLSIAGVFCTAMAIPVNILYKLKNGPSSAPFPGGVISQPQRTAAGGEEFALVGSDSSAQLACQYTAVGIAVIWALFDTGLDAVPDVELKVFSVLDIIAPTLLCLFTWPGADDVANIPFMDIPLDTSEQKAAFANWVISWSFVGVDLALLLGGSITWMPDSKIARYQDPAGKILLSALGAINLVAGIVASSLGASGGAIASNIVGPLPAIGQCLRLKSAEESSEGVTLAIKLALDFFAGAGNAVALGAA